MIDDILALLGQAKYFTSLHLKSGYWQVLMDDKDKEKNAFACHCVLFQLIVMPFGLTTAPAVFQELMSHVLKKYILYTDASNDCIGTCLTLPCDEYLGSDPYVRNEKPIYCLSYKLTGTQTRWSTIEKEAFAIHFTLQKLDHSLHNADLIIRTDHKPLKYLLDSPMQNKKIQLWVLGIAGYNCKIE